MRKRENEEYVKLGVTLMAAAAAVLLQFFMIYRFDVVRGILKAVWRLVRPFVNGALMAYLMVPMCNKLERAIKRNEVSHNEATTVEAGYPGEAPDEEKLPADNESGQ